MKIIFFILSTLIFCCCLAYADFRIPIEVVRIFDGDTIQGRIEKEEFSIRLVGIDCYETSDINRAYKQAYKNNLKIEEVLNRGVESKEFLEKLYKNNKNKGVYLDFKGVDKYGRALGVVYLGNINVNRELLNNGGCFEYVYRKKFENFKEK